MPTKDRWSALSMKDKAVLIKLMVENGVSSIDEMKSIYNSDIDRAVNATEHNFVQRLKDYPNTPKLDNGDGTFSTHSMASGEVNGKSIVFPTVQMDESGKLKRYSDENFEAMDRAIRTNDTLQMHPAIAPWYAENYKQFYNIFGEGGPEDRQKMYNSVKDRIIQQAQVEQMVTQPKMGEQPLQPLEYDIADLTTGVGDIELGKQAVIDVKEGNLKSAAIGAGMLLLPNFLEKPLRNVRRNIAARKVPQSLLDKDREVLQRGIKDARTYKESPQYKELVDRAIKESKEMKGTLGLNLDFPREVFIGTEPKVDASLTYSKRQRGSTAAYQKGEHNIDIDPKQVPYEDLKKAAYHEGLHSMNVGEVKVNIGKEYDDFIDAINREAPDKEIDALWDKVVENKETYTKLKQVQDAQNYLRFKNSNALYADEGYLTELGELQANGLEAGAHLGIKPFTPYPGKKEAERAIKKARRYNSYLWGIKDRNETEIKNFWDILTGQYTPIIGVGLLGAGTALSENNN